MGGKSLFPDDVIVYVKKKKNPEDSTNNLRSKKQINGFRIQ